MRGIEVFLESVGVSRAEDQVAGTFIPRGDWVSVWVVAGEDVTLIIAGCRPVNRTQVGGGEAREAAVGEPFAVLLDLSGSGAHSKIPSSVVHGHDRLGIAKEAGVEIRLDAGKWAAAIIGLGRKLHHAIAVDGRVDRVSEARTGRTCPLSRDTNVTSGHRSGFRAKTKAGKSEVHIRGIGELELDLIPRRALWQARAFRGRRRRKRDGRHDRSVYTYLELLTTARTTTSDIDGIARLGRNTQRRQHRHHNHQRSEPNKEPQLFYK